MENKEGEKEAEILFYGFDFDWHLQREYTTHLIISDKINILLYFVSECVCI